MEPAARPLTAPQASLPRITDVEAPLGPRLAGYLRGRCPPPTARFERVMWGVSQIVVGARLVVSTRRLLVHALVPVLATLAVCIAIGAVIFPVRGLFAAAQGAYVALLGAATISPVFFTRSYARMAAQARHVSGYVPHQPYLRPIRQALGETLTQVVVIALGMAPITWALGVFPFIGWIWAGGLTALWALYWVSVEALDSARTLPPGYDARTLEAQAEQVPHHPWYVRVFELRTHGPLEPLFAPARLWARLLSRWTRRWRAEIHILEQHRFIGVGFGAGAAILLAIPGLNLLFRPVVVTAAALMMAQLELGEDTP